MESGCRDSEALPASGKFGSRLKFYRNCRDAQDGSQRFQNGLFGHTGNWSTESLGNVTGG